MIRRTKKRIQDYKKRDTEITEPEYDTYCVTSVYILKAC